MVGRCRVTGANKPANHKASRDDKGTWTRTNCCKRADPKGGNCRKRVDPKNMMLSSLGHTHLRSESGEILASVNEQVRVDA